MPVIHLHQSIRVKLHLFLKRNNKADVQDSAFESIENNVLSEFDENYNNLGERQYLLTVSYTDKNDLDKKIEELFDKIEENAGNRDCDTSGTYFHAADDEDRKWE